MNIDDFPFRIMLAGRYVTCFARDVPEEGRPFPRRPMQLETACGQRTDGSTIKPGTVPRKCEACLRALYRK